MHFGLYLLRKESITGPQFIQAVSRQLETRPQIGSLAIETRCLSMRDVFQVLSLQSVTNESFGQLAIQLGILTEADIRDLLALQTERTTPLAQVLVDIGALEPYQLQTELQLFRSAMSSGPLLEEDSVYLDVNAIEAAFATFEVTV
ncbi:hypothetical protein C5Y96_10100 [Blastopirellula marina]|uniref:Type II secretion system protein GspE N-terminal domain-containing protein n=1 Tax=Blastopirellula marina TaxID=124 RepID=A0A2S8FLX9_9BACT|nr:MULTISPECIES: hypothetical protein [Pirellulaceae]PQO33198.1 hypothetical protein C5Y96_10100 [Blastopirellula marina]RCS52287.1 hypothetical protein DTL36_10110 [Bremerella cremea]